MAEQVYSDICEFSVKDIANRIQNRSCIEPRILKDNKWFTPISDDGEDMLFYQQIIYEDGKWKNQGFFGDFLVRLQDGQFEFLKFNAETKKMNI